MGYCIVYIFCGENLIEELVFNYKNVIVLGGIKDFKDLGEEYLKINIIILMEFF